MNKNIAIAALVLVLVCCLGVSLLGIAGLVVYRHYTSTSPAPVGALPTSPPVFLPTATPIPGQPDPTRQPAGTAVPQPTGDAAQPVPPDVALQMDHIEGEVSHLRGLTPVNPVQRGLLTQEELRTQMQQDMEENYSPEEMADDGHIFSIIGLLPPGFDLQTLYVDLMAEQVAGFYDPETKEMYVVQGEAFKGPERMTYAHEFTHVLQDQTYDLRNGLKDNPDYCKENSEYCLAVDAMVEGDASLTESLWFFRYATAEDKQEVQDFYSSYSSPVYDSTPYYLQQDLLFPYQYGLEFVQSLYDVNGFAAIDEAFRNPPVSSEQILHPERYPDDRPQDVSITDLSGSLGAGWREIDNNVMGEWSTYMILTAGYLEEMRMDTTQAAKATEGWGGDAYAMYRNDAQDQTALVMRSRWDTKQDLSEFWFGMKSYGELRWGKASNSSETELGWTGTADGNVLIYRTAEEVVWMIAPDAAALDALRSGLGQ